jgi:hypothetical protein
MDRGLAQPMASANEGVRKKIMPRTVADNPQLGVAARRFLCLADKAEGHHAHSRRIVVELLHDEANDEPWGGGVTDSHRIDFICAGCGARYKVVHVEAEPGPSDHLIHCTTCRKPLPATDDENNILKYFLVGRGPVQA